MDLDAFSRRIKTIAAQVEAGGDRIVRRTALAVDQAVVVETPVDEGTARSNWIAQLDTASAEEIPAYAPGKGGSTGAVNTEAALSQAREVIAGYDGSRNREIHITNNLPYIEKLNAGSSAQAPANYVEAAVEAGAAVVERARILEDGD